MQKTIWRGHLPSQPPGLACSPRSGMLPLHPLHCPWDPSSPAAASNRPLCKQLHSIPPQTYRSSAESCKAKTLSAWLRTGRSCFCPEHLLFFSHSLFHLSHLMSMTNPSYSTPLHHTEARRSVACSHDKNRDVSWFNRRFDEQHSKSPLTATDCPRRAAVQGCIEIKDLHRDATAFYCTSLPRPQMSPCSRELLDLPPTGNRLMLHNDISWDAGSAEIPESAHSKKSRPNQKNPKPTKKYNMCKQKTSPFVTRNLTFHY